MLGHITYTSGATYDPAQEENEAEGLFVDIHEQNL